METHFSNLRRTAALWHNEHALVADTATATNLRRIRVLCTLIGVVNGLNIIALLAQDLQASLNPTLTDWNHQLILTHLVCGLLMALYVWAANALRHAHRGFAARLLSLSVLATGILFSIVVVAIDQLVTPNITPFLIACVLSSLVLYTRPVMAAGLYSAVMLVFIFAMGWSQTDPSQVMLNQLNGFAICVVSWSLTLAHWRKFTTITLQLEQMEKLQAELQQKQKELDRLTRHDGLTGLYNRNTFVDLTRRELQRARRQGSHTTILLIDLDHFKRVNDTWGHPAGDAVLRHVAALVNSSIRSTDLAGRLGGEEFILLLPATNSESARKIAEKIRQRLEITPAQWEDVRINITASIGLSTTSAAEHRDFESLYNEADKALYLAKHRGRNRVM